MYSVLVISACAAFLAVTFAIAPNSVNINLETRISIGSQENIHNVLENITSFIDKLKYALLPRDKVYIKRRAQETKSKKYFTNFLNDVVQAILNLKHEETIWFFTRLYEEIKYYFKYKGSAFADIVKNPLVRKFIEDTLQEWSETDPYKIKRNIRNYKAIARNKNNTLNKIGDFINTFYDEKDEKKMQKIVDELKNCRKEKDFAKVVTAALHNLVIKHYDNLNYTIRTKISNEINRLGEYAIKRRSKGNTSDLKSTSEIIDNTITNNVSSLSTKATKETISTVKPIDKDIHENIIAIPEKGNVANDIEIMKNKYKTIIKDNFKDSDKKIVFRQQTESSTPTKKREKEITTKITTQEIIKTSMDLKELILKSHLKENINKTDMNNSESKIVYRQETENEITTTSTTRETIKTSKILRIKLNSPQPKIYGADIDTTVPPDINDGNIATSGPHTITNGTIESTARAKNGTSFENGSANKTSVSQNKETTENAIILGVNKANDITTKSAADILKHVLQNVIIGSLPTIPVSKHIITSTTIPELRVFGNKKREHSKTQVKEDNDKTTKSSADIVEILLPRNITIGSLPTILVPRQIKSYTIPELRVFGNNEQTHPKTRGKIPKKVRQKQLALRKRLTRQQKKTTVYIPPGVKRKLARLALKQQRDREMDIEDKIDAVGIDGK